MQALYVLQSLDEDETIDEITKQFEGDRQLVDIWTTFLIQIHWIERTKTGSGFYTTEEGKSWLDSIEENKRSYHGITKEENDQGCR